MLYIAIITWRNLFLSPSHMPVVLKHKNLINICTRPVFGSTRWSPLCSAQPFIQNQTFIWGVFFYTGTSSYTFYSIHLFGTVQILMERQVQISLSKNAHNMQSRYLWYCYCLSGFQKQVIWIMWGLFDINGRKLVLRSCKYQFGKYSGIRLYHTYLVWIGHCCRLFGCLWFA